MNTSYLTPTHHAHKIVAEPNPPKETMLLPDLFHRGYDSSEDDKKCNLGDSLHGKFRELWVECKIPQNVKNSFETNLLSTKDNIDNKCAQNSKESLLSTPSKDNIDNKLGLQNARESLLNKPYMPLLPDDRYGYVTKQKMKMRKNCYFSC